jgi:hypothetical protein
VPLLLGLALSLAVAPAIEGDTVCPTAAQVAAELRLLSSRAAPAGERVRLRLSPDDGALELELRNASGERSAQRRLPRTDSCADLAAAAAVVIAAWHGDAPPPPLALLELASQPHAPSLRYDVGASFVASFSGSFAPGALIDATLLPHSGHFGARLAVLGTGTRDQAVGSGHASWTRGALVLGPRARLGYHAWLFDFDAAALLALLYAGGVGLPSDRVAYNFDPGLAIGARAGVRLGAAAALIGVTAVGWLRREEITVSGTTNASLPQIEVLLHAGLALGSF